MLHIEYADFIIDVDEQDGMNICYWEWKSQKLIEGDMERKKMGHTYGMPIMFPTPNRTKNNTYRYEGILYKATMHGLFRNLPFRIVDNRECDNEYIVTGALEWGPEYEDFEKFPFSCVLKIHITIQSNVLLYEYELTNCGNKTIPYGFGIHPFFENPKQDATIMTRANRVLLAEESINTGETLAVKGTKFDLSQEEIIHGLDLDTIYMTEKSEEDLTEVARIKWPEYQLVMCCSKEFSHLVIYTPQNYNKFCVEPQTCSNDAMNLFDKGYGEISGIEEVKANETKSGRIRMEVML